MKKVLIGHFKGCHSGKDSNSEFWKQARWQNGEEFWLNTL